MHVASQTNGFLSPLKCWRSCGYNTETLCQHWCYFLFHYKVTLHWVKQWQYQLDGKIPCMLHNATHRPMNIQREPVLLVGLGPLLWQRHHDHQAKQKESPWHKGDRKFLRQQRCPRPALHQPPASFWSGVVRYKLNSLHPPQGLRHISICHYNQGYLCLDSEVITLIWHKT